MKIITKTLTANTTTEFGFDITGFEFVVKNWTNNDIYVSDKNENLETNGLKISKEMGQVVVCNKGLSTATKSLFILAKGAGFVEVQCINYTY